MPRSFAIKVDCLFVEEIGYTIRVSIGKNKFLSPKSLWNHLYRLMYPHPSTDVPEPDKDSYETVQHFFDRGGIITKAAEKKTRKSPVKKEKSIFETDQDIKDFIERAFKQ